MMVKDMKSTNFKQDGKLATFEPVPSEKGFLLRLRKHSGISDSL